MSNKTKETQNIPILFCMNNDYIEQLIVVITSILENNAASDFTFYIFHNEKFKEENKKLLKNFDNKRCKFIYKCISNSLLENFTLTDSERKDISLDTYSRFFAPKFITEYDKVIYLDCDIIVNKDIAPLYSINLDDNYIAGVEERCLYQTDYIKSKLHFSKDEVYINCGVLLMNLKKMREDNFLDKIISQYPTLLPFIKYSDQDILNLMAKGKIKKIDCIYNMTTFHVKDLPNKRNKAVIIHYTGKDKPWTLGKYPNELNSLYLQYYEKSFLSKQQKVKNFCVYHAPAYIFENELIQPIQTGTYGTYNGMDMLQSSSDQEIDYKNKNYGELTAWYWVWKNYIPSHKNLEYIGFCHYRRFLDYKNYTKDTNFLQIIPLSKFIDKFNNEYTPIKAYEAIKGYDIILPKKHTIEKRMTVEQQYLDYHPKRDLDILKNIIKRDYPEYVEAMDKVLKSESAYFCLLFTMKTKYYCDFMKFTFDILSKLEKESDWSQYNDYNNIRIPAYLIERFFNVWLEYNKNKYNLKILEKDAYIFEEYLSNNKQCTIERKFIIKLFNIISVFKIRNYKNKVKYYFLGIPVVKSKHVGGRKVWKVLGLPIFKIRKMSNGITTKYYIFNIPVMKISRK